MLAKTLRSINRKVIPGHLFYGPEWLVLGVNNICNLHCKMCDVGVNYNESNFFQNLMGSKPVNMPVELIRTIIDQAAKYFPNTKLGYAFTEPLIYPHLGESLWYAEQNHLFTSITTNALNLKRYGDMLLESRLNELYISLDGPQDIHNEIRGHKSSFQKAVQGMDALFGKEHCPQISIYCCITEWNIGHLVEFVEYFKDFPLQRMGFMHTNYTPQAVADAHNRLYQSKYPARASNMEEINLDNMDLDVLWSEIQAIQGMDLPFPVVFSPEVKDRTALELFYYSPEILVGKGCNDVNANIMIKSNGDVIPAHGRCYNLTIGNLYENDLKTIWNSEVISQFRKDLKKAGGLMPACARCCSAF